MRLAWRIDQSPSSVGSGTSSVSLRLRIRVETRRSVYDSSNSFNVSGDWPSRSGQSRNISHSSSTSWSSHNRTIIYDETITVSTSYTGTRTRSFSASFSGINAAPGTARVSGSRTVPRRPVNVPNTPSNVSASRNSDTSHRITWSQSTSSARPVTGFRIQRRTFGQNGWGGWVTRTSNVSSGSRAWTDTGTRNNRVYQWRVVAVNSAGTRTSSSTGSLWTTPYEPTQVSARRISGDRIRLDWRDAVTYGSSDFQIRHSENGGPWSDIATHSGGSYDSAQSWTHQNPNLASTHEYAIRSRTTSMSPTLRSSWVYSNLIQLAAPPNAPTITGPTVAVDAQANAVRVTWRHNPTDGSDQDSYQIRWRYEGGDGEWNTLPREYSDTQAHTFPAGFFDNDIVVQVQVRTWGAHNDPGPYSSQFTFRASNPPTVAINYPDPADPEHHEAHITAQWEYGGNVGQSHWEAELIRPVPDDPEAEGALIERRTGTGAASSVRFNRRLPDQTEWRVRVRVRAGDGLWSIWDQVDFTVSYPLPAVPEGGGAWDVDQGAVTVDVDEGVTEEGQEPTALVQLYRPGQAFFDGPAREIYAAQEAAEDEGLTGPVTNLVTNPRGRNTEGYVALAQNLVPNPRGRATDGVVTFDENLFSNPNPSASNDHIFTGGGVAAEMRGVASGWAYPPFRMLLQHSAANSGWVYQEVPASEAGRWLGFSAVTGSFFGEIESYRLRAWFRDENDEPVGSVINLTELQEPLPGDLTDKPRVSAAAQIPEGAASCRLYVWAYGPIDVGGAPNDGYIETGRWKAAIADTEAEALDAVAEYGDGDSVNDDPDIAWQWDGTPHDSASRLAAPAPVGWTTGTGVVAYYSATRDAVAVHIRTNESPFNPVQIAHDFTAGTYTFLTEIVEYVRPGDLPERVWGRVGAGELGTSNLVNSPNLAVEVDGYGAWGYVAEVGSNFDTYLPVMYSGPIGMDPHVGSTLYVRAMLMEGNYTGEYGDGDTEHPDTDLLWQWDGDEHNSTSSLVAPKPVGWEPVSCTVYYSQTQDALAVATQGRAWSVRWYEDLPGGTIITGVTSAMTLDEGMALRRPFQTGAGLPDTPLEPGDWEDRRHTWETHVSEQIFMVYGPADALGTVYFRALLVEGEYHGPYFDANEPDRTGIAYEWEGDENQSPSTVYPTWVPMLEEAFEQHAVPIGPPVEPGTSITDYIPPLNQVVPYRAEALTELGASQVSEIFLVETSPTGGWIHLNAGPGFSEHIRLKYNPGFSRAPERAKATHHFAGREEEVEIAGESRTTTGTITTSALTLEGIYTEKEAQATPREIEAFADFPAPVCMRVPEVVAGREFVSLGAPSIDHGTVEASVSIPWRKVHYDE